MIESAVVIGVLPRTKTIIHVINGCFNALMLAALVYGSFKLPVSSITLTIFCQFRRLQEVSFVSSVTFRRLQETSFVSFVSSVSSRRLLLLRKKLIIMTSDKIICLN